MTRLVSKIDYFQVLSMVQSFFIHLGEGTEGYRNSASRVVVTGHTGSKDCLGPSPRSHRQQNGVEQQQDNNCR